MGLTKTEYLKSVKRIGSQMLEAGFSVRGAAEHLLQLHAELCDGGAGGVSGGGGAVAAVFDGERDARLDAAAFPFLRQTSPILFDRYDRRFREGLELILQGAAPGPARGGEKRPGASR